MFFFFFFTHTCSFYQDRDQALHGHPLQTVHGKQINGKRGGIAKSAKAYGQRNIWWTRKHANARAQACECNELAIKHGANNTEQCHNVLNRNHTSLRLTPVYYDKIPSTQELLKFSFNSRVITAIKNNIKKHPHKYKAKWFDWKEFDEINKIQSEAIGLDSIRSYKLDENNNHAYLYWSDIQRDMSDKFKTFRASKCKGKKSRVTAKDRLDLLTIIFDIDEELHHTTDEEAPIKFETLIQDAKYLKTIKQRLNHRMTEKQIKDFINKEIIYLSKKQNGDETDSKEPDDAPCDADLIFELDDTEIGKDCKYVKYVCLQFFCQFLFHP